MCAGILLQGRLNRRGFRWVYNPPNLETAKKSVEFHVGARLLQPAPLGCVQGLVESLRARARAAKNGIVARQFF